MTHDHPMLALPTVDDLLAQLQAADPVRRAQAADLLGELGDRRAVAALIAALNDEHGGGVVVGRVGAWCGHPWQGVPTDGCAASIQARWSAIRG